MSHISAVESDHCFVKLEFRTQLHDGSGGTCQFRYENVWQSHRDYDRMVADWWQRQQRNPDLLGVYNSLNVLRQELEPWGKKEFGCLARTVRQLKKKLEKLCARSVGRGPSDEERCTIAKLREALRQEEVWLRQRSRVLWLRAGDRSEVSSCT